MIFPMLSIMQIEKKSNCCVWNIMVSSQRQPSAFALLRARNPCRPARTAALCSGIQAAGSQARSSRFRSIRPLSRRSPCTRMRGRGGTSGGWGIFHHNQREKTLTQQGKTFFAPTSPGAACAARDSLIRSSHQINQVSSPPSMF